MIMPFEAVLGIWAFAIVVLSIVIVSWTLKSRYDAEQKRQKDSSRKD